VDWDERVAIDARINRAMAWLRAVEDGTEEGDRWELELPPGFGFTWRRRDGGTVLVLFREPVER
jgi:hypothetical protein